MSNYLYRSNNNLSWKNKGLGKTQGEGNLKSCLRWKAYMKSVEKILNSHQDRLEKLCSSSDVSSSEINQLRKDLKKVNALSESTTPCNNLYSGNTDTPFKSSLIETINLDDFPKWKCSFNTRDSTAPFISEEILVIAKLR